MIDLDVSCDKFSHTTYNADPSKRVNCPWRVFFFQISSMDIWQSRKTPKLVDSFIAKFGDFYKYFCVF